MVTFDESEQKKKLSRFHKKEEESLAKQAAKQGDFQYIDLSGVSINTDALKLIPESYARKHKMATFGMVGKDVRVAAQNPKSKEVQDKIKALEKKGYNITLYVASLSSLKKAWGFYQDISHTTQSETGEMDIANKKISEFLSKNPDRSKAIDFVENVLKDSNKKTTRLVETIVAAAIAADASDIHIETAEDDVYARMRIDGMLQTITSVPRYAYERILSRLKLLSGMKLNINEEAQNGRFSIRINDRDVEIRSSIVPGSYGESIVMRLLNQATLDRPVEKLGMQPRFLKLMREEINRPKGLILNTGPTGSGKTTTLYSFLREMNNPQVKTITIENPVEYHLDGVVQTEVNPDEGYSFSKGLESGLRQDPDIIMVGEIRNQNTATTAMHAGLTGHRVLSTLHTNNAAGAFPRLVELGVKSHMIESAMNVAMAQRLVRLLCPECKKKTEISGKTKETVKSLTETIPRPDDFEDALSKNFVYEATGCDSCRGSGYQGRTGVFEAIIVDEVIGDLVRENPSDRRIWKHAQEEQKMLSMAQDGIIKVLRGKTDITELKRVIDIQKTIRRL